jgi:Ca2+:H+ antiporter
MKPIKNNLLTILLFIFTPIPVILEIFHGSDLWIFLTSAFAIIPLAGLLGKATEQLAMRTTPAISGLMNATLGNLAELIICTFALSNGYIELVKASLTGSIIGNILFLFGIANITGGLKYKSMKFSQTAAESSSAMLFIAVASLLVPSIFIRVGGIAHQKAIMNISMLIAAILILTYIFSLIFSLRTHKHLFHAAIDEHKETPEWSVKKSVILLGFAGVAIGFMSEFLVGSLEHTIEVIGLSEVFLGVVVIAIVGNAAEHSSAILMALKNKMDITLHIALGSSVQIALFVAPLLVFISVLLGNPMSLVFTMMEIIAVALAVGIIALLSLDGKSNWFEGLQMVALYIILAITFFFY